MSYRHQNKKNPQASEKGSTYRLSQELLAKPILAERKITLVQDKKGFLVDGIKTNSLNVVQLNPKFALALARESAVT